MAVPVTNRGDRDSCDPLDEYIRRIEPDALKPDRGDGVRPRSYPIWPWLVLLGVLGALVVWVLGSIAFAAEPIVGRASVIDGDTIDIRSIRIRLHGIDAPESGQTCKRSDGSSYRAGQASALALADRIDSVPVSCDPVDRDRYGRIVAICEQAGIDINAWLVTQGHAIAFRKYSAAYVGEEAKARAAHRGVWSATCDEPAAYRAERRPPVAAAPVGSCPIKGNINREGRRLYHLPGMRFYEQTRIDTDRGEHWFCSEDQARAAGWQKAGG